MMSNILDEQQIEELAFNSMLRVNACWLASEDDASFDDINDDNLKETHASIKIASFLFLVDQALSREHHRIAYTH